MGLSCGFILAAGCAFWVPILNALIRSAIISSAELTKVNESSWKGVPGQYKIELYHDNYFYDCTNTDNVIYKGEKPVFEEFGPYRFQEYDVFDDVEYD